jgi:hypothetical protein
MYLPGGDHIRSKHVEVIFIKEWQRSTQTGNGPDKTAHAKLNHVKPVWGTRFSGEIWTRHLRNTKECYHQSSAIAHYLWRKEATSKTQKKTEIWYRKVLKQDRRGWKLHNEELHNLPSSPSIIRMIKTRRMWWARNVARTRAKRKAYRMLVGKPEGKRPLRRPRCRWEDLKRDRIGWYGQDPSGSGQGPVEGSCEHGNDPSGSKECWEILE